MTTLQLTSSQCMDLVSQHQNPINSVSPTSLAILFSPISQGHREELWTVDSKGRPTIPINFYNSVEGRQETQELTVGKALGVILRGDGKIGFTRKDTHLLKPGGMGPQVHLEPIPGLEPVSLETTSLIEVMEDFVSQLQAHCHKWSSQDNFYPDSRHLEQLFEPGLASYLTEVFQPLGTILENTGIQLQPHLVTYGGGAPRTLLQLENLYQMIPTDQEFRYLEVPDMWGSGSIKYDSYTGENYQGVVGWEKRGSRKVYYRGQMGDLLH